MTKCGIINGLAERSAALVVAAYVLSGVVLCGSDTTVTFYPGCLLPQ